VLSALPVAADAADSAPGGAILGLLGGALTALGAFLAAWRWPTRGRRIQEHVGLLKDLPADADTQRNTLLQLLDAEMDAYAGRERVWLATQLPMACLYGLRLVAPLGGLVWAAWLTLTLAPSLGGAAARPPLLITGFALLGVTLLLLGLGIPAWSRLHAIRAAQEDRERQHNARPGRLRRLKSRVRDWSGVRLHSSGARTRATGSSASPRGDDAGPTDRTGPR
jgi:hypothetical protein